VFNRILSILIGNPFVFVLGANFYFFYAGLLIAIFSIIGSIINNENKILEKLNGFKQLYEEIDRVPQLPLGVITTKRFLSTLIMSAVAIVPTILPYIQELSIF